MQDPAFEYLNTVFEDTEPQTVFTMLMEHDSSEMLSFLTEQMSTKRGLKQFGTAGAEAIIKELKQIVYRKVMEGRKSGDLTTAQKKAALKYPMFLKQNVAGRLKVVGVPMGESNDYIKVKKTPPHPQSPPRHYS